MKRLFLLLLSITISLSLCAQGNKKDDKQSTKNQIRTAKIAYFTTEMGLTPEEAQEFWPVYNKYWEDTQKASRSTRHSLWAIKELKDKGDFSDVEMKKLINKYIADYKNEGDLQDIYLAEFYKILPVGKVAKLYLAEEGFRVKLTEMWKEQSTQQEKDNTPAPNQSKKPEMPCCEEPVLQ